MIAWAIRPIRRSEPHFCIRLLQRRRMQTAAFDLRMMKVNPNSVAAHPIDESPSRASLKGRNLEKPMGVGGTNSVRRLILCGAFVLGIATSAMTATAPIHFAAAAEPP